MGIACVIDREGNTSLRAVCDSSKKLPGEVRFVVFYSLIYYVTLNPVFNPFSINFVTAYIYIPYLLG